MQPAKEEDARENESAEKGAGVLNNSAEHADLKKRLPGGGSVRVEDAVILEEKEEITNPRKGSASLDGCSSEKRGLRGSASILIRSFPPGFRVRFRAKKKSGFNR